LVITHKNTDQFKDLDQTKLAQIVPGDIFYWRDGHIAIVQDVTRDADNNVTDIQLIESTFSGTTANVINANKLKDVYGSYTYYIVRLK
jgi:hypothetical protein